MLAFALALSPALPCSPFATPTPQNAAGWRLGQGAPLMGFYTEDWGGPANPWGAPGGGSLPFVPWRGPTHVEDPLAIATEGGRVAVGSSSGAQPRIHIYEPGGYGWGITDLFIEQIVDLDPSAFGGVISLAWIGDRVTFGDTSGKIGVVDPGQGVQVIAEGLGPVRSMCSTDIDGDGAQDLVYASSSGSWGWLAGPDFSGPLHQKSCPSTFCIAAGDLDSDGDIDVVLGTNGNSQGASVEIYVNGSTGGFPATPISIPTSPSRARGIRVADLLGDEHPEIAVCFSGVDALGGDSELLLLSSPGGAWSTWNEVSLDSGQGLHRDLLALDLDQDGDLDIASSLAQPGTVRLYENMGGVFSPGTTHRSGLPGAYRMAEHAGGFVVAVNDLDAPILFQNFTSQRFIRESLSMPWLGQWTPQEFTGDLDLDGVDDLLLVGLGGELAAQLSSSPMGFGPSLLGIPPLPGPGPWEAYAVDMTGDGRDDVYWRTPGAAGFVDMQNLQSIPCPVGVVVDWNSDGVPDVVELMTGVNASCPQTYDTAAWAVAHFGTGSAFLPGEEVYRQCFYASSFTWEPVLETWEVSGDVIGLDWWDSGCQCRTQSWPLAGSNCDCDPWLDYDGGGTWLIVFSQAVIEGCIDPFHLEDKSTWFGGPSGSAFLLGGATPCLFGAGGPPLYGGYGGLLMKASRWEAVGENRDWDQVVLGDFDGDGDEDVWAFDVPQQSSVLHYNQTDYGDCDGNGISDAFQITNDASLDCDGDGGLDECQIDADPGLDCDGNGELDACQIAASPSLDCDMDGLFDSCQIEADPSLDWNGDSLIDTCSGGGYVYCTSNLNASGSFGLTEPLGSPLIGEDNFSLRAFGLPTGNPGVPGMFIMSRSTGYLNPFGGGAGVLCLGAPIRRFNLAAGFPLQFSGAAGEITLNPPIANFPGPNPVQPGEVIHFQMWFREIDTSTGLPTSNTTDGISVMFR